MTRLAPLLCGGVLLAAGGAAAAPQTTRDAPIPHASGQSVTPAYEGWFPNPDGTFSLSFGYFNRNYRERLDIPIGARNRFEPGPADRGQPTHFLPRRQTGVFTVTVPADFGDRALTWTLAAYGETYAIPGRLRPEWRIDALREVTSGNTPPVVRFAPDGAPGQGPGGIRTQREAEVGVPADLPLWAVDDGVRTFVRSGRPPVTGLVWSKFRGPGAVRFSAAEPALGKGGRAVTTAVFDAPGDYVLRVLAWDDSGPQGPTMAVGFQCCWTNAYVDVRVREKRGFGRGER